MSEENRDPLNHSRIVVPVIAPDGKRMQIVAPIACAPSEVTTADVEAVIAKLKAEGYQIDSGEGAPA